MAARTRLFGHESFEPRPCDFLLALTFGDLVGIGRRLGRKILERRDDAEEFVERGRLAKRSPQPIRRRTVDASAVPRIQWERLIEVPQHQHAAIELDPQFASLENATVLIAKHRQRQLGWRRGLGRAPVDVEEHRCRRTGSVLENVVAPARRFRLTGPDSHVIRHEVDENVVHAVAIECRRERVVRGGAANLRIDLVVIAQTSYPCVLPGTAVKCHGDV